MEDSKLTINRHSFLQPDNLDRFPSERLLNKDSKKTLLVSEDFQEEDDLPAIFQSRKIRYTSFAIGINNGEKSYVVSRPDQCFKYPVQLDTCLKRFFKKTEDACAPCARILRRRPEIPCPSDLDSTINNPVKEDENLDDNYAAAYVTDDKEKLQQFLVDLSSWTTSFGDTIYFIEEINPVFNPVTGSLSYGISAMDNSQPPKRLRKFYNDIFIDLNEQVASGDCRMYLIVQGIMGSSFG